MRRRLLLPAAAALAVALAGLSAAAQAPAGGEQAEESAPAVVLKAEVKNGLLSVELADAPFGDVMQSVAARAGIEASVTGAVSARPLTTRFKGMELEEGIMRLLSLVQERNYFFSYDQKGRLKRVEVYGAGATPAKGRERPSAAKTVQPERPAQPRTVPPGSSATPVIRKNPPASQRIIRAPRDGAAATQPKETEGDLPAQPAANGADEAAPDSPREKAPPYIPPPPLMNP